MTIQLKDIRCYHDLVDWFDENIEQNEGQTADQLVQWFVAITEARLVSMQMGLKDIANLFMNGIQPINDDPERYIDDWLHTLYQDAVEEDGTVVDDEELELYASTLATNIEEFIGKSIE